MDDVKVSIVIPVYNVQSYLSQCLDSVINQTLKEIQIICVNDGSTDGSTDILNEYVKKDDRILVINQENSGCAVARKTGLKHSTGEYIEFVDSDDWLELDAIEKTYNNAVSNNSDLVLFPICRYDQSENKFFESGSTVKDYFDDETIDYNNFTFSLKDIKPFLLNSSFSVWFKLYKADFIKEYDDFYFPKHMNFEDVPFHVQVMIRAKKISFCPGKLYNYRTSNLDSITNSVYVKERIFDIFDTINYVENILMDNNLREEYNSEFIIFKINQLSFWFQKSDEKYKEKLFKYVRKDFEAMKLTDEEINILHLRLRNNYLNIMATNSLGELILYEEKLDLEKELKQQRISHNSIINDMNQTFKNKYAEQRITLKNTIKNYEDRISNQEIKHDTETKKHLKIIENLNSEHINDLSTIKSLENDLSHIKTKLQEILKTKPYRFAYFLHRFSYEFVKGNKNNKTDFLIWILHKITGKKSDNDLNYNPIMELIK